MAISGTEFPSLRVRKGDCVDNETGRLLVAFYSIQNGTIRQKLLNIITDVHNDEDAADEILTLVARALRRPDLADSP